jgi:hypothetical protein
LRRLNSERLGIQGRRIGVDFRQRPFKGEWLCLCGEWREHFTQRARNKNNFQAIYPDAESKLTR